MIRVVVRVAQVRHPAIEALVSPPPGLRAFGSPLFLACRLPQAPPRRSGREIEACLAECCQKWREIHGDADFEAAARRGEETRASNPAAKNVTYDRRKRMVVVAFSNGMELSIPPDAIEGSPRPRRARWRTSPSKAADCRCTGPALTSTFSCRPCFRASPDRAPSWLPSSAKKAAPRGPTERAARENGLRGGRPRKEEAPVAPKPRVRRLRVTPPAQENRLAAKTTRRSTSTSQITAKKTASKKTAESRTPGKSNRR